MRLPMKSRVSLEHSQNPNSFIHPETGETILINDKGGQGSDIGVRFDLLPAVAMRKIAARFAMGVKKYKEWNWLNCPTSEHINHLEGHVNEYQEIQQWAKENFYADGSEEDPCTEALTGAAIRAIMALEVYIRDQE